MFLGRRRVGPPRRRPLFLASSLRLALGFGFFSLGLELSFPLDVRRRAVPPLVDVFGPYELAVLLRATPFWLRQVVPRPVPAESVMRGRRKWGGTGGGGGSKKSKLFRIVSSKLVTLGYDIT